MRRFAPSCALAATVFAFGLIAPSHAEYVGPSVLDARPTVKEILANPIDNQPITLQGKLLKRTGKEYYIFSDGTGEITAEIDPEDFPRTPIDQNTLVQIVGEVDTGLRRPPEIDVETLTIVK